ncbi:YgaP-like transmembrane domain [Niallia sp.]|uniref:YgaP-like transmembrane domain n=1 Tax=Niallia sp. TaxID=2837523 RepID=UPI00289A18CE|nr:YgaP-like transmembrane domain [Niallia sp.]
MNPKQNISLINALIRITLGCAFLGWSTAKMAKKPYNQSYFLIALLAGMKIAEGIVRYCPVVALYGKKDAIMPKFQHNHSQSQSSHTPSSPKDEKKDSTSSREVAEMMEQFSPEKIFSPEDMKK